LRRRLVRTGVDVGKAHIGDLQLIAALLVVADRGAHECGDVGHVIGAARRIGAHTIRGLGIGAIDDDGHRKLLHVPASWT
jgi:hypothetical protein